jgi:membrane protease YdiL (CAAX protease family)
LRQSNRLPIASYWHTLVFILLIASFVLFGVAVQRQTGPQILPAHPGVIRLYLTSIVSNWLLLYFCWVGVHWKGGSLFQLALGRWANWKDVLTDLGIALPFWVIWEVTAWVVVLLLGPDNAKSVSILLPQGLPEVLLWFAVCATSGFCEELIFRGYLQKQLLALTGRVVAAVTGQAVVFGLAHSYKGWKQVVVICVLGILYGVLAERQQNLRANIIAHAWSDVYEGWLKFL